GGYTSVFAIPNLSPVPDCYGNLSLELEAIKNKAFINVYPYAAITKGQKGNELSDMKNLYEYVIGFTDDGKGVQNEPMMANAMIEAMKYNKIIAAHCEDESLLNGGYIHDGEYAKIHNHKGISSESEYLQVKRDLALAKEIGVKYHVCHVSTKESVDLIRKAKTDGVNVTCETAPHYLVLTDMDLQEDGRFKMNPPLRSGEDKAALLQGIKDGTIDMIATDHAPHSREEKSKGLKGSLMGVVGLETAFSVLYTNLVRGKIISLEDLIKLMSINPANRFGIDNHFMVGKKANFTVFDLTESYKINSSNFVSKGRATPFEGMEVFGKCKLTVSNGEVAWDDGEFSNE
ncbi:MAG: dihydroorotase, partial [Clostridia bacterium]|nr:dihydroorotase [Clostridia bacterium]